jgi:NitT/TauT family transport system ATP-binding protein
MPATHRDDSPTDGESSATGAYRLEGVGMELPAADGAREVLRGIDFEVGAGEFVAIVGRSGTGKTTLLRILGGLARPTSGRILLGDDEITSPPPTVVTVFQDYSSALLPWRTVQRNVALGLEGRMGKAERHERVMAALRAVRLDDRADEYPWRLSGGMQQRVQLARALALRPQVLLMDEPFGALDAMTKAALQDELQAVHRRTGSTIVFVTHDIEEAIYLSDRVFVISGQPGTLTHCVETELERPRDQIDTREQPRYLTVRHELGGALREES